jgi:multidrug resistance efflux pump
LVALALPAWTLGQQQPDAPPKLEVSPPKPEVSLPKPEVSLPKPEAPAEASPKPEASATPTDPSKPIPAEAPRPFDDSLRGMTIDNIRGGFLVRLTKLGRLAFRYSIASRDRPARTLGGGQQPSVGVKVADVVFDLREGPTAKSRLDILSYLASPEPPGAGGPNPGERPVPWGRQFLAQDGSGIMTFGDSWSRPGPVPFRWRSIGGLGITPGDDLAAALSSMNNFNVEAVNRDRSIDPLEPRPANVLDLAGAAVFLLGQGPAQLDVAGVDIVEGREVVRVAWVYNNGGTGLRGLLWVAPSLGYAVVRSEATQDPSQVGLAHGRRTWRKTAGDFTEVAGAWLPRKVEIRSTQTNVADGSPHSGYELVASFEDYRVNPELPPDTFHPKLKIEALDDQTGQFTTLPPKPSPSLIDRLAKAARESKFGPPVVEKTADMPPAPKVPMPRDPLGARVIPEPKGAAQTSNASRNRSPFDLDPEPGAADVALPIPGGRTYGDIVTNVDEAPTGRLMPPLPGRVTPAPNAGTPKLADRPTPPDVDAAKIDPRIIARPAPGFEDPIPISKPTEGDPIPGATPAPKPAQALPPPKPGDQPASVPPGNNPRPAPNLAESKKDDPTPVVDEELLYKRIERRFRMDPEVQQLAQKMKEGQDKLVRAQRMARSADDPSHRLVQKELAALKKQYDQLWESKSLAFREELEPQMGRARDEIELLQIRRNRKAADVRKAEAQRGLALAALEQTRKLRDKQGVGTNEVTRYEGELAVTEAELASKQTELDEADLLLNQAKRRLGVAAPDSPAKEKAPDQIRDEAAPVKGASPDGRDEVGLSQARRNRKAAEVQKAEAQRDLAKAVVERNEALLKKGPQYVSREEVLKAEAEMKIADAEVASRTSELEEADLLLNQAKRRLGVAAPDSPAKEKAPDEAHDEAAPEKGASPDGRDEIGLLQARRDGKAAELKKAEARLELARTEMQRASTLMTRHAIDQQSVDRFAADLKVAEADVAQKKADLDEADVLLNRAKRRPGDASTSTRGSSAEPGQSVTLAEVRDAVELMEIQLQGKQAELRRVEAKAALASKQSARMKDLAGRNAVEARLVDETEANTRAAESELETKKAEVLESEVRLKQARRRAEALEARLRREVERVKERLDWSEGMFKKGFLSRGQYLADRAAYDELMIQLDPKYVPAPAVAVPDGPPPPSAP